MFSWIHYPGLLTPGKRPMRGSVFWTLACCVILSGVVYSLSVTAREVQAQEAQEVQPVEGPPEDARQPVEEPAPTVEEPAPTVEEPAPTVEVPPDLRAPAEEASAEEASDSSPECEAARESLETAANEGSVPSQTLEDYENACSGGETVTIELNSSTPDPSSLTTGQKIVIPLTVVGITTTAASATFAYINYKTGRAGLNRPTGEAIARTFTGALERGESPHQAAEQAENAYEMRDFGNPQNGTGGNTQTPAGQGQQPQDARERPEGERPEGDTQSGNTCGPSQPVSLMKSDPLAPPVAPSEPVSLMKSNLSAQSVAPPLSEQCRERAEQERAEQEARDKGSKSPPRVGAPAKVAGGAGAGIAGDALEDFIGGVEESQNTDKVAEELRTKVSEQYPGYNVMVIQEETYDEPENIQGVQTNFTETIGGNVWDVWVFESGTFTNEGDLGYNNWVFSGNFELSGDDGETVTFSLEETEPEPEPLEGEEREDFLKGVDGPSGSAEHAKGLMRKLKERYPGYNVMVIQQETYEEPENLQGTLMTFPISPQFDQNPWDVWVFESGTFTNEGDLGYNNWVFSGNFERSGDDGETVTFESIEQ